MGSHPAGRANSRVVRDLSGFSDSGNLKIHALGKMRDLVESPWGRQPHVFSDCERRLNSPQFGGSNLVELHRIRVTQIARRTEKLK